MTKADLNKRSDEHAGFHYLPVSAPATLADALSLAVPTAPEREARLALLKSFIGTLDRIQNPQPVKVWLAEVVRDNLSLNDVSAGSAEGLTVALLTRLIELDRPAARAVFERLWFNPPPCFSSFFPLCMAGRIQNRFVETGPGNSADAEWLARMFNNSISEKEFARQPAKPAALLAILFTAEENTPAARIRLGVLIRAGMACYTDPVLQKYFFQFLVNGISLLGEDKLHNERLKFSALAPYLTSDFVMRDAFWLRQLLAEPKS